MRKDTNIYRWHDLRADPDDLPEDNQDMLCYDEDCDAYIGYYCRYSDEPGVWRDKGGARFNPTHWRYLDKPTAKEPSTTEGGAK